MAAATRPVVICLTPVKDEAWVIERFLLAASSWADAIVVADQGSTDGSREIAASFEKVVLVDNPDPEYNEGRRQRLLIDSARRWAAGRPAVLLALDADELLTADAPSRPEWQLILDAPPGTVIEMPWVNLLPGGRGAAYVKQPSRTPFGYVDDGREHTGEDIHSRRVPAAPGLPRLRLDDVAVLHLVWLDWERLQSKQRFYQCYERLTHPAKRPVQLFRQYHHMEVWASRRPEHVEPSWLAGYAERGIDVLKIEPRAAYGWDRQLLEWLAEHGSAPFRRLDIWTVDWAARARALGMSVEASALEDPRSAGERRVFGWLHRTQATADRVTVRLVQQALRPFGW